MNVHTCTVLPESTDKKVGHCMHVCFSVRVHQRQKYMHKDVCYLSDLEFIGDIGGDVGAGVSASSSSSSPHSSSLRGVMLLPNHTEWMETWGEMPS